MRENTDHWDEDLRVEQECNKIVSSVKDQYKKWKSPSHADKKTSNGVSEHKYKVFQV